MKSILLLSTLFMIVVANAQNAWEKVEINSDVYISFPAAPVKTQANAAQKTFILKMADSTANYIVVATDLGLAMGIDAATLSSEMEKEESWEQAKNTFISSMGEDATLMKDEMIAVKGIKTLKLNVDRKNDKGGINHLTVYIFVKGTVSYNVMFNNRGGKADDKMKQQFFDSIEIK